MFEVKTSGFDELQKKLRKMRKNLEELEGEQQIPIEDLMTNNFIMKHTEFEDFYSFVYHSEIIEEGKEITRELLDSDDFDKYVKNTTNFGSWKDMIDRAVKSYISKKLDV